MGLIIRKAYVIIFIFSLVTEFSLGSVEVSDDKHSFHKPRQFFHKHEIYKKGFRRDLEGGGGGRLCGGRGFGWGDDCISGGGGSERPAGPIDGGGFGDGGGRGGGVFERPAGPIDGSLRGGGGFGGGGGSERPAGPIDGSLEGGGGGHP